MQVIFRKIREEQVRKWTEREAMIAKSSTGLNEKEGQPNKVMHLMIAMLINAVCIFHVCASDTVQDCN